MRRTRKAVGSQCERGAVAVEAAIVLPVILVFLGLPSIVLAFYLRHYSAVQKAAHDAALYLSTAPRVEMTTAGTGSGPAAMSLAKKIIEKELTGVIPDATALDPGFVCVYRLSSGNPAMKPCTLTANRDPSQTLVQVAVSLEIPFINPLTGRDSGTVTSPYVPVRYLGN